MKAVAGRSVSLGELVYVAYLAGGYTIMDPSTNFSDRAYWIGVAQEAVAASRGANGQSAVHGDVIDVQIAGEAVVTWPSSKDSITITDSNDYIRHHNNNFSATGGERGRGVFAYSVDRGTGRSFNAVLHGERIYGA